MTKYEYAKLCLQREKNIEGPAVHKFETRVTGETFTEDSYGLIGVLDAIGERGWQAFNKTHHTIWFSRPVDESAKNSRSPYAQEDTK